ncbi:P-loop containing nucleoside triphosphate hydrolase protein [Gautieria morchelliformis]|nr:P-loop containing nucleoside triphosphate hydrolase protein [Gautieria morchelliformis]
MNSPPCAASSHPHRSIGVVKHEKQPEAFIDCQRVLTEVFGHSGYKGKQKEIIEAAICGVDVLVIAPTGLGKSLCFQIPAIARKKGVTIVISPLLALMKDQVAKLREIEASVAAFTSETSVDEKQRILRDLRSGHPTYRLLYVTPEKLCTSDFTELLEIVYRHQELNRLVVDEAHCISEWGHDFRKEYRRLGSFRTRFPDVPIMALTASATANVQNDIATSLKMSSNMYKALHPFNRPNLYYEVRYLQNPAQAAQMADVQAYINTLHIRRGRPSSGIIYCRKRATCDELAKYLRGKGLNARPYHRGLKSATLDRTLEDWQIGGSGSGGVDLVVATIAFGCGIDKSDVRYVIHYDLPRSLEAYYQETGRAGRDGTPSKCILYYSREDGMVVREMVSKAHKARQANALLGDAPAPTQRTVDSLSALIDFAESTSVCRHVLICRYFGEQIRDEDLEIARKYCQKMCDVCKYPDKAQTRHSKLSSAEFLSTQVPRAESPTDLDDDDNSEDVRCHTIDDMQSKPAENVSKQIPWKGDRAALRSSKPPVPGYARSPTKSLGLKRTSIDAAKLHVKKFKTDGPVILGPLSSTRLTDSLKKPFKTPFKEDQISTKLHQLAPQQHESGARESSRHALMQDMVVVLDDEMDMIESARVTSPASPPVEIPDEEIVLDASYSQKVPIGLRKETHKSIRKALQKVFMQSSKKDALWRSLNIMTVDSEVCYRILALAAEELEFTAHSYCSTEEGYRAQSCAQVLAVNLLQDDDVWNDKMVVDSDEQEDAVMALSIIRRIAFRLKNRAVEMS